MWPNSTRLNTVKNFVVPSVFRAAWRKLMSDCCHHHPVWDGDFVRCLRNRGTDEDKRFALASVWSVNMVVGSYCFPRYVAALAARAEMDAVRHGLLENAWDESGSYNHTSRSHFWLAVKLARLLGLRDDEIERIEPLPEAQKYTDEHYRQCAVGDFAFALGMICLIEEFTTPEFSMIFNAFLQSCQQGMNLSPGDFVLMGGAEYFTANITDDERHREEMPQLVAILLDSDGVDLNDERAVTRALSGVRDGASYSSDLRMHFFEGIYQFVKSGGTMRRLMTETRGALS